MTEIRRVGRPPVSEVGDLRSRALAVMLREGYDNVSMTRLAQEIGVSVRTLHRYFPAKTDIVWGGIEGSLEALRQGFATADETAPILDAIAEVIVAVFEQNADDIAVGSERLRLIATTPQLQFTRPETYRLWREETVHFIARRLSAPPDGVVPRAIGSAVQSAIAEALAWWANDVSGISPAEAVNTAIRGFEILGTDPFARPHASQR